MGFNSFEDMPVWEKALELSVKIFELTDSLPKKEDYDLTSQIRRSALSVPGNIAEGFGRKHTKDKLNFYYDAGGSLSETKNHLIYGHRVGYFDQMNYDTLKYLIDDTWKQMNMLISSLEKSISRKA